MTWKLALAQALGHEETKYSGILCLRLLTENERELILGVTLEPEDASRRDSRTTGGSRCRESVIGVFPEP